MFDGCSNPAGTEGKAKKARRASHQFHGCEHPQVLAFLKGSCMVMDSFVVFPDPLCTQTGLS